MDTTTSAQEATNLQTLCNRCNASKSVEIDRLREAISGE